MKLYKITFTTLSDALGKFEEKFVVSTSMMGAITSTESDFHKRHIIKAEEVGDVLINEEDD